MSGMRKLPPSAVVWAATAGQDDRVDRLGLVDAFAVVRTPAMLRLLGEEGEYVELLRRRARVGLARSIVEYGVALSAVGGATVQGTGDMGRRISYAFEPTFSAPLAAILLALAAVLLVVLHVFWVRPSRERTWEGLAVAAITCVSGVVAAVIMPAHVHPGPFGFGTAGAGPDSGWGLFEDWRTLLVMVVAASAVVGAASFAVQATVGVREVRILPDATMREAIALQWQAIPEAVRDRVLQDRDEAVDLLAGRGLIGDRAADQHRHSAFGAYSTPLHD